MRCMEPCTVVVAFSSGPVKIRCRDNEFVVNGNRLKQYYLSVPLPVFRHPEVDILIEDGPKPDKFMDEP